MQKGRLKSWVDQRGFGFIQPDDGSEDVFVHISALQVAERRPMQGDVVFYSLVEDENGRIRAATVSIQGVKSVFAGRDIAKSKLQAPRRKPQQHPVRTGITPSASQKPSRVGVRVMMVCAILLLVAVVARRDKMPFFAKPELLAPEVANVTTRTEPAKLSVVVKEKAETRFQCQGKTHCSQMTSCEEATFYLNHCPGSVTDGDGDGRPCEDQWCGH